ERAELAVAVPAVAGDDGRRDRLRLEGGVALERGCRRASLAQFGEHGRDLVDELADRFAQDAGAVAHRSAASVAVGHGTTAARDLSGTSSWGVCPQSSISSSAKSGRRAASARAAAAGTSRSRSPCTMSVGQVTRGSSARMRLVRYQNNDRAESAY